MKAITLSHGAKTITIVGSNSLFEHLVGQTWECEIRPLNPEINDGENIHLIIHEGREYVFNCKGARIFERPMFFGFLQDGNDLGRIAFELI